MAAISTQLLDILTYLLPGFVTAWMFHAFTSYPKRDQFERIVQALIFTVFIQGGVFLLQELVTFIGKYFPSFSWKNDYHLAASYVIAVILGFVFSSFANNDLFHRFLRYIKVTKETSYHCEWFGTFNNNPCFIIIHLNDERRIFGWPTEWPSDPTKGHLVLMNPSWVTEDGYKDMPTVNLMMFNVSDIKWVEFLQETPGVDYV